MNQSFSHQLSLIEKNNELPKLSKILSGSFAGLLILLLIPILIYTLHNMIGLLFLTINLILLLYVFSFWSSHWDYILQQQIKFLKNHSDIIIPLKEKILNSYNQQDIQIIENIISLLKNSSLTVQQETQIIHVLLHLEIKYPL
jgi:hypothetical protein